MAHLIDKHLVERANTALLLGILWGGLGTCELCGILGDEAIRRRGLPAPG
jgi:hypothetical protein